MRRIRLTGLLAEPLSHYTDALAEIEAIAQLPGRDGNDA